MEKPIIDFVKTLNDADALPENYSCLIVETIKEKSGAVTFSCLKIGASSDLSSALCMVIKNDYAHIGHILTHALHEITAQN